MIALTERAVHEIRRIISEQKLPEQTAMAVSGRALSSRLNKNRARAVHRWRRCRPERGEQPPA